MQGQETDLFTPIGDRTLFGPADGNDLTPRRMRHPFEGHCSINHLTARNNWPFGAYSFIDSDPIYCCLLGGRHLKNGKKELSRSLSR